VSQALVRRGARADTIAQLPPSITEFPWQRRDAAGSDHRPLFAVLDLDSGSTLP
jgi:hypothetical protein